MTLQQFGDLLATVTDHVYHYEAAEGTSGTYIVWQEIGGRALYGSDQRVARIHEVQVKYYTGQEFDPVIEHLTELFEANDIAFQEPTVTYDSTAKTICYLIACEMIQ